MRPDRKRPWRRRWPNRARERRAGFTLLELLVAIALLALIAGIVYESFAGVTDATEIARLSAEKLRLQRYLTRTLTALFSTVHADAACMSEDYYFLGTNNTGRDGPADAIEFCSSAPTAGAMSLPGALKRVTIEVTDGDASDQTLDNLELPIDNPEEDKPWSMLRVTETPLVITAGLGLAPDGAQAIAADAIAEATQTEFDTPSWTVPVHTLDITYFDGADWVEEWDSIAMGRMPWCVRVMVNFARRPEELEEEDAEGVDILENPDFDLVIPIPMGEGALTPFMEAGWTTAVDSQAATDADDNSQESERVQGKR